MAAKIIPFQQRPAPWAAPACLVELATDMPACIKTWYILQCVELPTKDAEDKAIHLLWHSEAFFSKLYGKWIKQCEKLSRSDKLQREIGRVATIAHSRPDLLRENTGSRIHISTALLNISPRLEALWWEMDIEERPRLIRSAYMDFVAELHDLQ